MYYVKDKYEDDTILVASSLSDETFRISIDEARSSDKKIAGVGAKSIIVYSDVEKFVAMMNMRMLLAGASTYSFRLEYGRLIYPTYDKQCYVKAVDFSYTQGKVVEVPYYVDVLETDLFAGVQGLDKVILHNDIVEICSNCFSESSIQEIDIPNKIEKIPYSAFSDCVKLKKVSLPSSVEVIGDSAFEGCYALSEINLPEGLTEIASFAFANCSSLVLTLLPESLVSICPSGLPQLQGEFNLPNIEYLGTNVFTVQYGLKGVTTGEVFDSLDKMAFSHSSVEYVDMSKSIKLRGILDRTFEECINLKQVLLPDSVEYISAGAFCKCMALSDIKFPSALNRIGVEAFMECPLTRIEFGDAVATIGRMAFAQCTEVEAVVFPDSLTRIESYAFTGCSRLSSISLPASIKKIGEHAFSHTNLKKVYFRGDWSKIEMTNAFDEGVEFIRV